MHKATDELVQCTVQKHSPVCRNARRYCRENITKQSISIGFVFIQNDKKKYFGDSSDKCNHSIAAVYLIPCIFFVSNCLIFIVFHICANRIMWIHCIVSILFETQFTWRIINWNCFHCDARRRWKKNEKKPDWNQFHHSVNSERPVPSFSLLEWLRFFVWCSCCHSFSPPLLLLCTL